MSPVSAITPYAAGVGGSDCSGHEEAFKRALERETNNDTLRKNVVYQELSPPGDCTWAKHKMLQDEVDRACKSEKATCKGTDSVQTLHEKIEKHAACVAARVRINATCFRGGDAKHKKQVTYAINGGNRCHDWLAKAEKRKTNAIRDEKAAPASTRSFLEKMEKVTGLTGAALVAYLIASEGSRLFLPRNLVPVP